MHGENLKLNLLKYHIS